MTTPAPGRLPLRRPVKGRVIGGVCEGLALHLGVPVVALRVIAVIAAFFGVGLLAYVFWWVTIPAGDPYQAARAATPVARQALGQRLDLQRWVARVSARDLIIGTVLLVGAVFLVAARLGWDWQRSWLLPAAMALGGLGLAWSQLDAAQRGVETGDHRRLSTWVRPVGGLALLVGGVLVLIAQDTPGWAVVQAGIAAIAVLVGFALVLAPWWLRLVRELNEARDARAREAERADIAAHLHDSVLQTLALIRAQASDAEEVSRLARAQERELREWMYSDRPSPGTSFAAELRTLVGQSEDASAVAIDVVVVGDTQPTDATTALLQAAREALVNAASHGRPPISVYAEVTGAAVEVFVRDRGDGFDPDDIAADRFGVRRSIIGRMQRRGGSAEIVSRPTWGTEVRLRLPLTATDQGAQP